MRTFRTLLVALLVLPLAFPTSAFAQARHAVDPAAVAATLHQHVVQQDAHRAAIREALTRPEVREVAARAGIDIDRMVSGLGMLSGEALEQAGKAATQVNQRADGSLVGGASTIVISTTTIIIALLLILLLVIAVD